MAKGIYKRGNIYWIRYAGLDGRIIFESSCSDKFKVAEALLIQRRQTIKEGKQPEPLKKIGNHIFNELVAEYLKWTERQRSFRSKHGFVKQLTEAFGNIPLRRFNTMLVEQYQTEKLNKGNKPATINRHIATLKHMLNKAVDWSLVEEETLKRIRKVKLLPENNRRLRYLSKEECQALINACDNHLKPIVITALNTGMRKGEILSLKWDNVDLKHGFILLDMTKNGERREMPINRALKALFLDKSLIRRLDVPYVFYDSATGKPYQDIKRSFHTALRKAGIKDFKFHDLRHTFASHLIMAGVDITTVSRLLGHKSLTMTLRYSHLAPSHMAKAVDLLDSALNEKPTIQKLYNPIKKELAINA
ncbi:MAG: putative defective protein IntQ [candidate division WS2 bacterium]|nr:putative defective protein IntQ [Candidatus Lithacetigena glycinireducens]